MVAEYAQQYWKRIKDIDMHIVKKSRRYIKLQESMNYRAYRNSLALRAFPSIDKSWETYPDKCQFLQR